jgi:hypothetical protein
MTKPLKKCSAILPRQTFRKEVFVSKHLSYDDGHIRAEIDIRPATTGDGIQRGLLTYDLPKDDKLPFRARTLFANLSIVSTIQKMDTPQSQIVTLTPESLLDLPDALTTLWEMKVLDVNPQWRYGLNSDQLEEIQKKALTPLDGLPDSIEPAANQQPKI